MVLAKDDFVKPSEVEGLEIVPVTNNAEVQAFERLRTEARGGKFPEHPERGKYMDDRALSEHIAVMAAVRARGIEKAISAYVIEHIDNVPVLDADPPADQLYKQIGFHDVGYLEFWAASAF